MKTTKITWKKDPSPGSFSTILKKEVYEYFAKTGKNKEGNLYLYIKTFVIFLLLGISYWYALYSESILMFGVIGFFVALVGFNVMHDASHGSYFEKDKEIALFKYLGFNVTKSDMLRFLGADTMGGSGKIWHEKHDIIHHTWTNIVGTDNDISRSPMFRFAPSHEWKWYHKYQHIYCWFLYPFLTLGWFYIHDFQTYKTQTIDKYSFKMTEGQKIGFWIGKTVHITLFIVIPIVCMGWKALIGILLMHMVASLFLALVFQMAHIVQGLTFIPEKQTHIDDLWYVHELNTTANFAAGNWFWTLLLGGLNYQVEHHLFRDISHVHYPAISKIVQRVCREMNVKYFSFPTFGAAIVSHYRHLKELGRAA